MLSTALLLFIVLDPFGNLVTLNTLLAAHEPKRRRRILLRESAIALAILLLAVFGGGTLLGALGLQPYTLGISGGIVLFMIALGMLFPSRRVLEDETLDQAPPRSWQYLLAPLRGARKLDSLGWNFQGRVF